MHEPVLNRLEDLLDSDAPIPEVEAHLQKCVECREELAEMKQQHELFAAFRAPVQAEPAPGFYARVLNQIETQTKPSIWNLFGESLFAKRLAYASMSAIVLMGSYFIASQPAQETLMSANPEAILADQPAAVASLTGSDTQRDREAVLVNLATYQQQDVQ